MVTRLKELVTGTYACGWVADCGTCGERFIGRKGSAYCSNACRQAAHRGGTRRVTGGTVHPAPNADSEVKK